MLVDLFSSVHTDDTVVIGEATHKVALLELNHAAIAERHEADIRRNIAKSLERKNEKSLRGSDISGTTIG